MATQSSTERIEFRLSADLKKEIETAALLLGQTVSSFAASVLLERAREVKRGVDQLRLDDEERIAFMKMLENDLPSDALVALARTPQPEL